MLAGIDANFETSAPMVTQMRQMFGTDFSSPPSAGERPRASGLGVSHSFQRGEILETR